ncbi:nucleoside deaminase [Fusibacter bizertensis]
MTQNDIDEKYIRRANQLANIAKSKGEDPFGAVLVRNNEIIYESYDGCIEFCDPTFHAEKRLISEYCRKNNVISLEDCTLYSSTEPCSMCSGAIHWAKISRLVFGIRQEVLNKKSNGIKKFTSKDILDRCGNPIEVKGPVLEEECLATFEGYKFILKKERINLKKKENEIEKIFKNEK